MVRKPADRRWNVRVLLALGGAVVGGGAAFTLRGAAVARAEIERGRALFAGSVPLRGRMTGHETPLPPEAVRCTNCHPLERTPGPSPAPELFALKLTRDGLTRAAPRRGGPPSVYDGERFCRLLRDGIDPAHVMIPQTMPRYELEKMDCQALWVYVTSH
jgi:hypothetical protein